MNSAIVARAAEIFDLAAEEAAAKEAVQEETVQEETAQEEVVLETAAEPAEPAPAPSSPPQGSKLYVGNLPWTCDSTQLAEICQDHGVVETVEVIYDQQSGRSRGFAFVTMASTEDAQAVINALDGNELGGRPLKVNYPQPKGERPRFERTERPEGFEGGPPFGGERRRDDNPNKLFVGNLTWGCNDEALYELFSGFGKVVDAKVVLDRESGRSRGFGFVTMETWSEVNSAIENLDGSDYEGRQLRVNMAGDKPPPRQY